jgi:hypothetical protein
MEEVFKKCCDFTGKKKLIVCEENRSIITFHNITEETVAKIRVDGCVIPDKTVKKCDYLLLCEVLEKAVLVELKGNKVGTAIEQLSATLDNETVKTPLENYEKKAYAVVTGNPVLARFQKAQAEFSKRHKKCVLRVVRTPHTCDL